MSAAEVTAFLDREFPQLLSGHGSFVIETVGPMTARVRLVYDERHLRPGGTLSGPSMFGLCDVSLYIAILAQIGPVALAVTTNLNINFLRRPQARDLLGECQLIKLGKRLAARSGSIPRVGGARRTRGPGPIRSRPSEGLTA